MLVDFDHRMTVSYVMNQMLGNRGYDRSLGVLLAAYEAITS